MITIQEQGFSHAELYEKLREHSPCGAIVTFTGLVREFLDGSEPQNMIIEHFPGMVENVIQAYISQAKSRWQIHKALVVHRVGSLKPGEQIVFVGVSSEHRAEAFEATQFIMDKLKSEAPFWKRENQNWVEAKQTDQDAANRWD